ncbi:ATP-binding protein [Ewingella americana]|uniref:ATP-binding protein n=1 Tax=Ewingella americana TaxID=41202 RepID=A0A502GNI8_9GAMM|nr:ATP-binding protein [Ewingella americana]TPG62556.1 ATP-binding protein [Ewingella americana]
MNAAALRQLVITALTGKTDAGEGVYSPRDWPTSEDMYPAILVQTPFDLKNSLGRNVPQFTTVTTVRVTGRLQELDEADQDNGAVKAQDSLEQLREQIERALINSYDLTRQIQQFLQIRSTVDISAAGEGHTAQLLMELDIEYYQGPEEFYPIETTPLEGVDITIIEPDGTPEVGVTIDLPQ